MIVNYLILILTTRCDLRCAYCYNGDLSPLDMDKAMIEPALALAAAGTGPLRIQLTGGEPTLVPELIVAVAKAAEKLRRPYRISLQTNGLRLEADLVRDLKKYSIEIGVSLDGAPAINDAQRGRSREVLRGLGVLERLDWPFVVTTVVTSFNGLNLYQTPLILSQYGLARGLGLDLLIQKGRSQVPAITKDDLAKGVRRLIQTLRQINARRKNPLTLREEEFSRRHQASPMEVFCQACRQSSLAVTPLGLVYPCGQTAFDDRFKLGDVWSDQFLKSPLPELVLKGARCQDCFLRGSCPGECPSRLFFNQVNSPDLACVMWRVLAEEIF
ncbi:MAG: radical SAM protein [Deltaproteobacteria bacterium]|jgi:uncharacterized protein|nr:radical SAM protein [Deltaproteobacteria bacterium]